VQELIDQGLFLAREALAAGLVDLVPMRMKSLRARKQNRPGPLIEAGAYRTARTQVAASPVERRPARLPCDGGGPIKRGETVDSPEGPRAIGSRSFARD